LTIRSVCSYVAGWLAKKSEEGGGTKQKLGTNPSSSANPPPLLPREPAF
jgi:hypothetical protein